MNKLVLMFVMIFATYIAKAQDEVPSEVHVAFTEKYPEVNMDEVDWDTEDFYYKAEFEHNDEKHDVRIDKKGNLVSAESNLSSADVPAEIQEGLAREFGNYELKDAAKFETSESTLYKMEVETDEDDFEIYTDESGQIIEKSDS